MLRCSRRNQRSLWSTNENEVTHRQGQSPDSGPPFVISLGLTRHMEVTSVSRHSPLPVPSTPIPNFLHRSLCWPSPSNSFTPLTFHTPWVKEGILLTSRSEQCFTFKLREQRMHIKNHQSSAHWKRFKVSVRTQPRQREARFWEQGGEPVRSGSRICKTGVVDTQTLQVSVGTNKIPIKLGGGVWEKSGYLGSQSGLGLPTGRPLGLGLLSWARYPVMRLEHKSTSQRLSQDHVSSSALTREIFSSCLNKFNLGWFGCSVQHTHLFKRLF